MIFDSLWSSWGYGSWDYDVTTHNDTYFIKKYINPQLKHFKISAW